MTRHVLLPDRVFDTVGGRMLEDHAVVVEGETVREVVPGGDVTATERLEGYTLLPGLVDVHTHLAIPLDTGQGFAAVVQRSGAQDALLGVKHADVTIRAGFTAEIGRAHV